MYARKLTCTPASSPLPIFLLTIYHRSNSLFNTTAQGRLKLEPPGEIWRHQPVLSSLHLCTGSRLLIYCPSVSGCEGKQHRGKFYFLLSCSGVVALLLSVFFLKSIYFPVFFFFVSTDARTGSPGSLQEESRKARGARD